MKKNLISIRTLGMVLGIVLCIILWNTPITGLSFDGQKCLALILGAMVWWVTGVSSPGFTALGLLSSFYIFLDKSLVPAELIFKPWTTATIYLVVGGFLLAYAVEKSGLGKRFSLFFLSRFANSWRSIIICCYVLGALLSILIPHPWPRSFLLMSIMNCAMHSSELPEDGKAQIGLAIFAGSVPSSMILLTGDSTLNVLVGSFANVNIGYFDWILYMGLPALLACTLTCTLQLLLFRQPWEFTLDKDFLAEQRNSLGKMSWDEKKVSFWICLAVILWMTASLHGIHPGWVGLWTSIALSLPVIGDILDVEAWKKVHIGTLFFLVAAISIGTVSQATGLIDWIVTIINHWIFPSDPLLFALFALGVCMCSHLVFGSAIAVLGAITPIIIKVGSAAGISPIVCSMIAYTAIVLHWVLPMHHVNLLVGLGKNEGGYTEHDVLRFGSAQTIVVVLVCIAEILWWTFIGLI
ncbi:MAG TPA: SLC13 family permease [Clostridia bacterium]|nr:SLC13 family permease [Clostridia bacterium]